MPTLNWIGKDAVVRHHREVPFRLLEPVPALSCVPDQDSGDSNLIVQGDNLHALKALLPRYSGRSSASISTHPTTPVTRVGFTTITSIARKSVAGWAKWLARKARPWTVTTAGCA